MRFGVLLAVKNVKAARAFYEELFGLTVVDDFGLRVTFDCGLSLQQNFSWLTGILSQEMKERENNGELYFEEMDFDCLVKKIKKRSDICLLHDVMEQSWGQRVIRFYDLDQHLIEVGENMKFVVERLQSQGMKLTDIADKMDVDTEVIVKMLDIETENT